MKNKICFGFSFLFILLFIWPKTQDTSGQFIRPKASKSKVQSLQQIVDDQQKTIQVNKDSLSSVMAPILAGDVKPKPIIKYRWRTKLVEVHDTVYAAMPGDHNAEDYFIPDKDPCPDTVYIPVPAVKKQSLFKRIFKHKN